MAARPRPVALADLRRRVAVLERSTAATRGSRAIALGVGAVDRGLPGGGLALGGLHEIAPAEPGDGAATGFAAFLLARVSQEASGPILWCAAGDTLYAPGLRAFGLDPGRLLLARGRRDEDVLWAMQEGLSAGALAAVLGEVRALDLTQSRRLQLAAEARGTTALVLRPHDAPTAANAALTRWRLAAAPATPSPPVSGEAGIGPMRWRAELMRCRGGVPGTWLLEWNDETDCLALAAEAGDRPARPVRGSARRRAAL